MRHGFILGVLTTLAFALMFDVFLEAEAPSRDATCVPLYAETGMECCQ